MTKEERLAYQRNRRKQNGNADTKKYEKTKQGFLMRLYRNMSSRVLGIQKQKQHLYQNKSLLSREAFYSWANNSDIFHSMFQVWENSGYDRKLCPTVDRKDSSKGYEEENMRWLTHSENSALGALAQHGK